MITPNSDCNFIEVKFVEVVKLNSPYAGENELERTSCQIDLENELLMMQRNIRKVKNPVKKSRLIRAYEGLVELLIA
jgi:hypothetical protein